MRTSVETTKLAAGPLLYAGSVAWSSALLFVVQPIMAKSLLPRFGGSAGVWIACLMFFQVALLLGYLYSFCLTRFLGARAQAVVHLGLLTLSLGALPLKSHLDAIGTSPTAAILLLLASSVGLPYFALAATSPLLQSWLAGSPGTHFPYRLFALSNAASLVALLAYPVAIEPLLSTRLQMAWWSGGYVALVFLLAVVAAGSLLQTRPVDRPQPFASERSPWLWIALAACASTLWLATANYLGQQVAAMPFLWVAPMLVYLLSFILCFEADGWYRPALFRWLMPIAWIAICSRIAMESSPGGLRWEIPVFSAALFICCMFCHGELARSKPAPQHGLAFFYLMVASGGALGGVFVGLVAPNLFPTFLELPLGVTASVFLALYFLWGYRSPRRLIRLGVVATLAFVVSTRYDPEHRVVRTRNFYGALQIRDVGNGDSAMRALYSGRTLHGLELLDLARRSTPTTYYGVQSGAGLVLAKSLPAANRRVAVVGLGAGTLATYGRAGDFFRFYEINPAVIQAAAESFDFLRNSAATTDVVTGDGRLLLEREPAHSFDLVVLDAFSDDAIPVHLLTRQAFELYFDRLRPGGLLLIHLTNRYLDLSSEVETQAAALRKEVLHIHSVPDAAQRTEHADWAIVGDNRDDLAALRPYAQPPSQRMLRPWSDEYSSLFQLWK
jgi:SAM-dependent methyltransferase